MGNGMLRISPSLLCFGLLCFFLPFISVSCGGQKLMTLSGLQMATGMTYREPGMFGNTQTHKIQPEPLVFLAFGVGLAGSIMGFARGKAGQFFTGAAGVLGLIFLLILKFKLENEISKQGGSGVLQMTLEPGYWGTAVLYLASIVSSIIFSSRGRGHSPPVSSLNNPSRSCGNCGAPVQSHSQFCASCGHNLLH